MAYGTLKRAASAPLQEVPSDSWTRRRLSIGLLGGARDEARYFEIGVDCLEIMSALLALLVAVYVSVWIGLLHELVRQLLGHNNLKMTTNYYAGINTLRAGRAHSDLLVRLRTEITAPKRKLRRS